MARITKPPQFSFDDSLVPLNRRQDPVTQTQRGNYEWTWAQASLWLLNQSNVYAPTSITVRQSDLVTALMFGSDVPQLAFYFAEETNQGAYNAALKTFLTQVQAFTVAINAWGVSQVPALTPVTVAVPPSNTPILCVTRAHPATRPGSLTPPWGTIQDQGQGALVSVTYANADNETTFAQGFPLLFNELVCVGAPEPGGVEPTTSVDLTLTVGYESQINHGLAFSQPTFVGPDAQPAYTPILLRREDYSPAIYAAGNVITQGNELLVVVGLWDRYQVPAPTGGV